MQVPVRTNNICMICIIRLKWTPTLQLKFLSDMTFIQKDLKLSVLFLCFYSWLDYTYIYDFFREFFFAAIYKTKIVIFVHYGFSWWLAISLLFSSVHKYKYKYSHAPLADPGGGVSGFGTSPPFSKTSVCRWLGRGGGLHYNAYLSIFSNLHVKYYKSLTSTDLVQFLVSRSSLWTREGGWVGTFQIAGSASTPGLYNMCFLSYIGFLYVWF